MLNSHKQQMRSMEEKRLYSLFLKRSSEMAGESKSTGRLLHTENARSPVVHAGSWNVELIATSRSEAETASALCRQGR